MTWPPTPPTYRGFYVGTAARRLIGGLYSDKNWMRLGDQLADTTPTKEWEYVNFNADIAAPPHQEGRVFYDRVNHTFAIYNDKVDVTLQLGQEEYVRVVNDTGSTIVNGSLVYITGVDGPTMRPTVALARADVASTAAVIGMATHDIGTVGDDKEGLITTFGIVRGLNTDGIAAGTHVHLSDVNAGEWVETSPVAPSYALSIGIIVVEDTTVGSILIFPPPIDVLNHMVINQMWVNNKVGYAPTDQTVTAAGGINPTNVLLRVISDGGRVAVTANPQMAAGLDGQIVILTGRSDTDSVILHNGDGLRLQGMAELADSDVLTLMYHVAGGHWEEVSRTFKPSEKSWAFASPQGSSGINYIGGFYDSFSGNDDFTVQASHGLALRAYGAHLFVVLGENTVDTVTLEITGTSIDDQGNRVGSDTEIITVTHPASVNDYFETTKKWIGTVTIDHDGGTAREFNYGYAKYWDNNNNNFVVTGFEATFLGGATDTDPNIALIHHKATGWTYVGGGVPLPPSPIADMETDYSPEHAITTDEPGAYKRSDLFTLVAGAGAEGIMIQLTTNFNKTFAIGNFMLTMRSK